MRKTTDQPKTPIQWLVEELGAQQYKNDAAVKVAIKTIKGLKRLDERLPPFKTTNRHLGLLIGASALNPDQRGTLIALNAEQEALDYLGAIDDVLSVKKE